MARPPKGRGSKGNWPDEIQRDRDRSIKRKQKRHLNEQRQTASQRIAFFHQLKLLHLQLLQTRIGLLEPFDLSPELFISARASPLFHRLRRAPLQMEEERVDHDRKENDRDAIAAGQPVEI